MPPSPPCHVLIVDDSAISRRVLAAMVEVAGHRCSLANDGAAALAAIGAAAPDVILMDAVMPELDGYATTRALRALPGRAGRVPVIGLTAGLGAAERAAFAAAGADLALAKPASPEEIAAAIAAVRTARAA
jgi:CheY-like chemotaxis protein